MDFFPTFVKLAGGDPSTALDASDMSPLLFGSSKGEALRKSFVYYRGTQLFAVRHGKWKAHFKTRAGYGQEPAKTHETPLLFDLDNDPGENFDVAAEHPSVIAEIRAAVAQHRKDVPARPSLIDAEIPPASP